MQKIKQKLSWFTIFHGIIVVQSVVLIVMLLLWSPWKQYGPMANQTSSDEQLVLEQTAYGVATISATNKNTAIYSDSRRKAADKKVLATVISAENQTYTSDNRLFITGDEGIFELVPTPKGDSASSLKRAEKQSCAFGGIIEVKRVIYANCYDRAKNTSYVYAASLDSSPVFKNIHTLSDTPLANGLTADTSGRLYVASTFNGKILRLTPSAKDPYTISQTETWLSGSGIFTNGIKFYNNAIYWTDGASVKKATVKQDGKPSTPTTIFGAVAYLDDLIVDSSGYIVADYTGGYIRSFNSKGASTSNIPARFNGPSSVTRARSPLPPGSYIVTERANNTVSLVTP